MQLIADRFAMDDEGRVVDLATGMRVILKTTRVAAPPEQLQWAARCDLFQRLRHRAIAPLVDYGVIGRFVRFEAWQCGPAWSGAEEAAARLRTSAEEFLHAINLATNDGLAVHVRRGAPVVVPDVGGSEAPEVTSNIAADLPLALRGLMMIQRTAVAALADMFGYVAGPRPHVAAVWGPPGSGKTTLAMELARLARLKGFVPIASRYVGSTYDSLWQGRSVFVIEDGDGRRSPALLHASMQSPVPHVVLVTGAEEANAVRGLPLGRISADDLVAAVYPRAMNEALEADARAAAEAARGSAERFLRLLWPDARQRRSVRAPQMPSRAAEQPIEYGGDERLEPAVATPPAAEWVAPGELAALRRKLGDAFAKLGRGRHAAGIRQLRQTVGALVRRGAWADATDGALPLAETLLRRGRPRDALRVLNETRTFAGRCGNDARLLDAAVLAGEAWIDLARLDEAETVFAAAVTSAAGDRLRTTTASLGLARCLFWRGKYDDAAAALTRSGADDPPSVRLRRALLTARIDVGRCDIRGAVTATSTAADAADADDIAARTAIAYTTAFVHLAIDDLDAVERHATIVIGLARQAHDPLRAIRARLLLAEAERRRGRSDNALDHVRRIGRIAGTLPPLVKARVDLMTSIMTSGEEVGAAHIAGSGLAALALFLPIRTLRDRSPLDPLVVDAVSILRACQTAEDELVVLHDVCGRVRQQLHAAAVAIVAADGARDALTTDGGRVDTEVARRAIAAGITIAPHQHDGRIEAAAPIHCGGAIVGALAVRWTIGSTYDLSRAATVLTMTAAAAAPILSAALAHRRPVVPSALELIGVTPAMQELRRAVERAAPAPFAVLVEGESGCGKELVAQAIHRGGLRRDRPLRTLNCAALPDDLVEAELFGHVRGSFTGASGDRTGVFEEAHGGTLFLDEVGELSPRAQAKLLRVIQEGEIRRVGENLSRRVDVRIVAATNRDLRQEVDRGRFRVDLLYRLDVIRITVPPLRERTEDVPLLVEHFWREATSRVGSRATLAAATHAALARYHWPGNVRELQNVLASLAVRSARRGVVGVSALPPQFAAGNTGDGDQRRLEEARRVFDERFIRAALVRSGGHRGRAAAELGVTRQGLTKLMARLGISSAGRARDTGSTPECRGGPRQ